MSSHIENSHSSFSEEESPFFADVTLDLAEAHDIAETPEPTRKTLLDSDFRTMPNIPHAPNPENLVASNSFQTPTKHHQGNVPVETDTNGPDADMEDPGKMNSITSGGAAEHLRSRNAHSGLAHGNQPHGQAPSMTPSVRRWPRDVQWAVGFAVVVPLCLLVPILFSHPNYGSEYPTNKWIVFATAPRLATSHALLWGYAAALVLSRLLYRTMGGGDGDDARHFASQILLASAPISVSVYVFLVVAMYFMLPHALIWAIIPLWFLARDLFLFRTWKMTAITPGGRQAFFQALTCMTLDILSRSLRRSSFYRIVSLLLIVQFVVIYWWRSALLAAMQSGSGFWILLAALGGKWATGTVARILSLIASGGICSWFAEQDSLVQELYEKGNRNQNGGDGDEQEESIEFTTLTSDVDKSMEDGDDIPEAYRTADASAYKSVLQPDEGMDDDFDDEEEEEGMALRPMRTAFAAPKGSNVKQLLFSGLSTSFGSVAKCGLLGGLAQFVWSQLRKIDTARATFGNLQGMAIGGTGEESMFNKILLQTNVLAREFVRNNSDMAMSHVAAFHKTYQRAAQDVAVLIDESGVEPMIHEDISTHMSACVGGSVSGVIVIFTGSVLVHQRNRNNPDVSDSAVLLDMLLAFIFCYTLIFTVMEPLRAAIKAVYVSFAQHPQALSQSFPLIYHRLSRMSNSNLR